MPFIFTHFSDILFLGPDFARSSSRNDIFDKKAIAPGPGDYDLTSDKSVASSGYVVTSNAS